MQALCLAARGGILSWSKNIHFSLSRRPGWTDFSAQGLHMRNVKWSCTYFFPTGNQSLWLTNTFRPYTQENLHYHPVASRLLERPFLRWLFGAADPTKLARCCRDRSSYPTYTISFNARCKRRPRVLGRYGGPLVLWH